MPDPVCPDRHGPLQQIGGGRSLFGAMQKQPIAHHPDHRGGIMSQHKKVERKKELDRRRRRREKSLKLRAKEAKRKSK